MAENTRGYLNGFDDRIYRWGVQNQPPIFARACIIRRPNYGKGLDTYLLLANEARKHFPQVKDSDLEVGKISNSGYMDGHAVILFDIPFEQPTLPPFEECGERMDFNY